MTYKGFSIFKVGDFEDHIVDWIAAKSAKEAREYYCTYADDFPELRSRRLTEKECHEHKVWEVEPDLMDEDWEKNTPFYRFNEVLRREVNSGTAPCTIACSEW